jgi:hypothetical protein
VSPPGHAGRRAGGHLRSPGDARLPRGPRDRDQRHLVVGPDGGQARAGSGACLGWSHAVVFRRPSRGTWVTWNAVQTSLLFVLGTTSALVYSPRWSMAQLMVDEPPLADLLAAALPLMFVLTAAGLALRVPSEERVRLGPRGRFVAADSSAASHFSGSSPPGQLGSSPDGSPLRRGRIG